MKGVPYACFALWPGIAGGAIVHAAIYGADRRYRRPSDIDGLPAQLAPRERPAIPDDPREPWSRNYGTVRSSQIVEPPTRATAALSTSSIVAKVIPQWPSFLRTAQIDEDAIIRQAIAEHEMRQED